MNSLFGDATTIAPTPETLAEVESLFSGNRSPVASLRLDDPSEPVPDMDLQPPEVEVQDGKPLIKENAGEGVGGWISNVVKRATGEDPNGGGSGRYRRVDQEDET